VNYGINRIGGCDPVDDVDMAAVDGGIGMVKARGSSCVSGKSTREERASRRVPNVELSYPDCTARQSWA
jgi:hypothetical protein